MPIPFKAYLNLSIVTSLAIVASSSASATPIQAKPNTQSRGEIENPTRSSLLADSHCPRRVWVLPPTGGAVENHGRRESETLSAAQVQEVCLAMSEMQERSRRLAEHNKGLSEQADAILSRIDEAEQEIEQLEETLDGLSIFQDEVQDSIDIVEEKLEEALDEVAAHAAEVESVCGGELDACEIAMADLQDAELREEEIRQALESLRFQQDSLDSGQNRIEERSDAIWESIERLQDRFSLRQRQLKRIGDSLKLMYRQHANMAGDSVDFAYTQELDGNVDLLSELNPNYRFSGVSSQDVRLRANMIPGIGTDAYLSQLPSVLSINVGGYDVDGSTLAFSELPRSFQGELGLSMIATCPARDKDTWDIVRDDSGDPMFGTLATYQYQARSRYELTAEYDMTEVRKELSRLWDGVGLQGLRDIQIAAVHLAKSGLIRINFAEELSRLQQTKARQEFATRLIERLLSREGDGKIFSVEESAAPFRLAESTPGLSARKGDCFSATGCTAVKWSLMSADSEPSPRCETWSQDQAIEVDGSIVYTP